MIIMRSADQQVNRVAGNVGRVEPGLGDRRRQQLGQPVPPGLLGCRARAVLFLAPEYPT